MRLSTLALLIVLPAMAYAVAFPQQDPVSNCLSFLEACGSHIDRSCCPPQVCLRVRPSVYGLALSDRDVRMNAGRCKCD